MICYTCRRLYVFFFFSSRRRHTRCSRDWSSDVCSSDLTGTTKLTFSMESIASREKNATVIMPIPIHIHPTRDRKSTRLNSSHGYISYAVFCLKKKKQIIYVHNADSDLMPCVAYTTQYVT